MVLKFSEDVRYVGPAAGRLEEVDIAFILGLIVASAVYLLLMRRVDLAAEQPAIAESERVLAELDGQAGVDTVTAVRA